MYRGGRPNRVASFLNGIWRRMAAAGLAPQRLNALEVRGRLSGRRTSFPVVVADHEGERYLISYRGASEWARNLEASHTGRLAQRGRVEEIVVEEVPVEERGPLLEVYTERFGRMPTVGAVLRKLPDPADHPTFRIVSST